MLCADGAVLGVCVAGSDDLPQEGVLQRGLLSGQWGQTVSHWVLFSSMILTQPLLQLLMVLPNDNSLCV